MRDDIYDEALIQVSTLEAQVQFAVDYMNDNGWLEEGCFTFPDGTIVHATQTMTGDNDEDRKKISENNGEDAEVGP